MVEFGCASPGASSFADLAVASVESLSLNGSPLAASAWRDGRLALSGLESSNVLEVTATVSSGDDKRGLVSFVDKGGERFVYTYGRTDGVVRWAPCFLDVPAEWDLRVAVPDGWRVQSHGPPVLPPVGGVWRFVPPYPLPDGPTFAAGPWARVEGADGVPQWARPSVADSQERLCLLDGIQLAISHGSSRPFATAARNCDPPADPRLAMR